MTRTENVVEAVRDTINNIAKQSQQMQPIKRERGARFWLPTLLLGLMAGITTGLLVAPRRGEETREMVQKQWMEYTKDLPDRAGAFLATTRSALGKVTSLMSGMMPGRAQPTA